MGVFDNLIRKLASPIIDQAVKEQVDKANLEKGIAITSSQMLSFAPTAQGKNRTSQRMFPRGITFQTLRDLSLHYPILRSCVNYRKRQITRLDWSVTRMEVANSKRPSMQVKEDEKSGDIKKVKELLKYPTGDKSMSFRAFINRILEDAIVLDAVAIYRRKNKGGGIMGYLPIDGATIKLILHPDGTTPQPPEPAYVQKVQMNDPYEMTSDELIYSVMNPRNDTPYGLSPVESLVMTITTALKLSAYNLAFLTEGNVPEGLVELPRDIANSPDQLKLWQEAWDVMISGKPEYQRKLKFLPEGMKLHQLKKPEDITFDRFEKWLLLNTCSIMEVAPQTIGFQFDRGKGATEAEWEIGKERGLYPLAAFIKEIFDLIIQEDLGYKELEFIWTNVNPTNLKEEADVFGQLVRTGAYSVDEWRVGEGMEPIGLDHYIMTPVGPILVRDLINPPKGGIAPIPIKVPIIDNPNNPKSPVNQPQNQPQNQEKTPDKEPPKSEDQTKKVADIVKEGTRKEVVEELKRWKKAMVNDLKSTGQFRDFKTSIVDIRTQGLIRKGVLQCKTKDDVEDLFDPLINQENKIVSSMLDLYDEILQISTQYETLPNKTD